MLHPRCNCVFCQEQFNIRRNTGPRRPRDARRNTDFDIRSPAHRNPRKRKDQKRKQREKKIKKKAAQKRKAIKETDKEAYKRASARELSIGFKTQIIEDMDIWHALFTKITDHSNIEMCIPYKSLKRMLGDQRNIGGYDFEFLSKITYWKIANEELFRNWLAEAVSEKETNIAEKQKAKQQKKRSQEEAWELICQAWKESPLNLTDFADEWKDVFQQLTLSSLKEELQKRHLPLVKKKRHKKRRGIKKLQTSRKISSRKLKTAKPATDYKIMFVGGDSHGKTLRVLLAYEDKLNRWFEIKEIATQGPKKIPSLPSTKDWDLIIVFSKFMSHEQINAIKRKYSKFDIPIITASKGGNPLGSVPAAAYAAKKVAPWFYDAAQEMGIISKKIKRNPDEGPICYCGRPFEWVITDTIIMGGRTVEIWNYLPCSECGTVVPNAIPPHKWNSLLPSRYLADLDFRQKQLSPTEFAKTFGALEIEYAGGGTARPVCQICQQVVKGECEEHPGRDNIDYLPYSFKRNPSDELHEFIEGVRGDFIQQKKFYLSRVQELLPEVKVIDIDLIGSYSFDSEKEPTENSDIDLLILYQGNLSEDAVADRLYGEIYGYGGTFDIIPEQISHHRTNPTCLICQQDPCDCDPEYIAWLNRIDELLQAAVGMSHDELPADYMWADTFDAGFSPVAAINLLVGPLDDPNALLEAIYIEGSGLGGYQRHHKLTNQEIADIALEAMQDDLEDDENDNENSP